MQERVRLAEEGALLSLQKEEELAETLRLHRKRITKQYRRIHTLADEVYSSAVSHRSAAMPPSTVLGVVALELGRITSTRRADGSEHIAGAFAQDEGR